MNRIILLLKIYLIMPYIQAGPHEKALLNYLFDPHRPEAHNVLERPVENDNEPLVVKFKVSLTQLVDVDEKNQIVTTNLWLTMTWNDYMFRWNPADYGNVTTVMVHHSKVWKPDILMYNSADENFDSTFPTNVVISNDGGMLYVPPGMFKSTCEIKITYFPFDRQVCTIKFGSWSYDGNDLNLMLACDESPNNNASWPCSNEGLADTVSYTKNGEWSLIKVPIKRFVERYSCCDADFIDLKIFLHIQRRALYYTFNLIIPCILISIIALLVFTLPPGAGEKISLGVTILLSLTMFTLLVADSMPQTSDAIPLIGIYFSCVMLMASMSLVFTVLVINYHFVGSDAEEMPRWIKIYVNYYLASYVGMIPPQESDSSEERNENFGFTGGPEINPKQYKNQDKVRQKTSNPGSRPNTNSGRATVAAGVGLNSMSLKDRSSKSLLANVLDLDDDFRVTTLHGRDGGMDTEYHHFSCYHPLANQIKNENSITHPLGSGGLDTSSNHGIGCSYGPNAGLGPCTTKQELEVILAELQFITQKIKDQEQDSQLEKQWKLASRVIDRCCLIFFSLFTAVATVGILLSADTLWDGETANAI